MILLELFLVRLSPAPNEITRPVILYSRHFVHASKSTGLPLFAKGTWEHLSAEFQFLRKLLFYYSAFANFSTAVNLSIVARYIR